MDSSYSLGILLVGLQQHTRGSCSDSLGVDQHSSKDLGNRTRIGGNSASVRNVNKIGSFRCPNHHPRCARLVSASSAPSCG